MQENTAGAHIVVLGASYAGLLAALRVAGRARRAGARVTLVNATDSFVERIRLHQLAAGQPVARRPLAGMLRGTGVALRVGRVVALAPADRRVTVATPTGEEQLSYDRLIYALGSVVDTTRVPGVAAHALSVGNAAEAERLRERLASLAANAGRVVVCGGGLTGLETAAELAESHPALQVCLVTRGLVGPELHAAASAYARQVLVRLGVYLYEGATVKAVAPDAVVLANGARLAHDLCIWAGSFRANPLAAAAGLPTNARGQVRVDAALRVRVDPHIYAVGDAAAPEPGVPIRMACATAMPMAAHAADNLAAELTGRAPQPFRFAYVVQCVSLGRHAGIIQFVQPDDTPTPRIITGWAGARLKELVCRYPMLSLALERRWPGSYRWPQGQDTVKGELPERAARSASGLEL